MRTEQNFLIKKAIGLLRELIATPSFSSEEDMTAQLLENWFHEFDIPYKRVNNNVYAFNKYFDKDKPTLLAKFTSRYCKTQRGLHKRSL